MILTATLTFLPAAAAPATGAPVGVDGRVLTTDKTGDISDWVEIAQYNGKSLIVRANFINITGYNYGNSASQYTSFGTDMKYTNSVLRNKINHWFSGVADYANWEDVLPPDARLRDYTYTNNATSIVGTCNTVASMSDGYSLPTAYKAGIGNDVAFALSYGESANFLSTIHFQRNNYLADQPSNDIAKANVNKINIPYNWLTFMWLRSPGDIAGTAGALDNEGSGRYRAFQCYVAYSPAYYQMGLVYPALWVDSAIFGPDIIVEDYAVTYHPNTGDGEVKLYMVGLNSNYMIMDQGYTKSGYAFAGWNTQADGSGTAYQNYKVIQITNSINLYAQWKSSSSIVYHSNGSGEADVIDYGANGTFTIKQNMFNWPGYTFYEWSTTPSGLGATLPPTLTFSNFTGTLHLYARWYGDT